MAKRTCSIDGCERTEWSRDMCGLHYGRWWRTGSVELKPKPTAEERFWAKVDKSGECWLWTAHVVPNGYGFWGYDGVKTYAHRYAYEVTKGPIPDGLHIDHVCHSRDDDCHESTSCMHRRCVRPAHLEAVTQTENNHRTRGTHCKRGHPMTDENVYIIPSTGGRQCGVCQTMRNRGLL